MNLTCWNWWSSHRVKTKETRSPLTLGKVPANPQGIAIIEDAKRPLWQGGEHHSLPGLQVPASFLVLLLPASRSLERVRRPVSSPRQFWDACYPCLLSTEVDVCPQTCWALMVLFWWWVVLSISWKLSTKSAMGKLSRLFPHTKFEPFKVGIRTNDGIIFD